MKKLIAALTVGLAVVMFAGCGGNHTHENGEGNHSHNGSDHDGHGHGHGDEHGNLHEVGEKDFGDGYEVHVFEVEQDSDREGIYEVKVMKGGKALPDVEVDAWYGDKDGKEVAPVGATEWMADEEAYDSHIMVPPGGLPEGAMLWIRIRHEGKDQKHGFELHHDED